MRYISPKIVFGYPLISIAVGPDVARGENRGIARGIIAIGDIAKGLVAIGGISIGVISIGGVSIGILSLGGVALGLLAALGGLAIGGVAVGGVAIGVLAIGGVAIGGWAFGAPGIGILVLVQFEIIEIISLAGKMRGLADSCRLPAGMRCNRRASSQ
jgi:hypothetical protein